MFTFVLRICFLSCFHSPQDITVKWDEVKELVPKRGQVLQAELMRQQHNEDLRRKFGEKANIVGPWIEGQLDAVAAIGMGTQGTLEDQKDKLLKYEDKLDEYRHNVEELEKIHQEVQESMIFENSYTQYTMEVCFAGKNFTRLTSIYCFSYP